MRVPIPLLIVLSACAHVQPGAMQSATQPQYELAPAPSGTYVVPPDYSGLGLPCAVSNSDASSPDDCKLSLPSAEEAEAFQAEVTRLEAHPIPQCRRLGEAMRAHLGDIEMYDNAIVRYDGPDTFYGVGHSYQSDGAWTIRVARRLDALNERRLSARIRTLRHEVSHTFGAPEGRDRSHWSADDYADRCR
jgi:hypothetical protein